MAKDKPSDPVPAPLGGIEPHALMLTVPPETTPLYKIMTVENFLRSVSGGYLHFSRVDSYKDFDEADIRDSEQTSPDRSVNAAVKFEKAPNFSAADYYDQFRARTYACCFSIENSDFIWTNYGNGSVRGKVCIVFNFAKLRFTLNRTLESEETALEYNGIQCRQIFSINFGTVNYVDWREYRANVPNLPNPVTYTYLKDKKFGDEKELRISLSTEGMGKFVLSDGSTIEFPASLLMRFDFKAAILDGTIERVLRAPDCDSSFLEAELYKLGITAKGSDVPHGACGASV